MAFAVGGMIVFWLATFAFVWSISRRQSALEDEISVLRQVMDKS